MLSDGLVRSPTGSPPQNAWSFPRFPMPAFHRAQTKAAPPEFAPIQLHRHQRAARIALVRAVPVLAQRQQKMPRQDSRPRRNRWAGLTVSPRATAETRK